MAIMGYTQLRGYLESSVERNSIQSISQEKTYAQQNPIVREINELFLLLSLFCIDGQCDGDHQRDHDHKLISEEAQYCQQVEEGTDAKDYLGILELMVVHHEARVHVEVVEMRKFDCLLDLFHQFLIYHQNMSTKCSMPGCPKAATMQCPTCKQMDIGPSFFCTQQCFKAAWPVHKLTHISKEQVTKKKYQGFKFTGPLRPGEVSKMVQVPEHIQKPDYYFTSVPKKEQESKWQKDIEVKDAKEIQTLRQVALLARKTLDIGHQAVKAGITTDAIDKIVHQYIIDNNAYPSPLNYYKFPKSLCTSVNEVICHGIPDSRPLEKGDIVNLDVTVYKNGMHVDLNQTYFVGQVSQSSRFLVQKAYTALEKALEICKPGTMYRDIGNVIGKYIEENGLAVNRTYCGHGIGSLFHVAPNVPHYSNNKAVGFMKPGHVFTIQPMINAGVHKDITWPDNWTAVTADGQRSAQFQHTILITQTGHELLTKRLPESPPLEFKV